MLSRSIPYLILGIFELIICFQDIKSQAVNIWVLFSFLISCVFFGIFITRSFSIVPLLIFIFLGMFYYIVQRRYAFGLADYVVVFAISFLIPEDVWPFFLILSGAFGILSSIFYEKKRFPFIPALIFSTDILMILS